MNALTLKELRESAPLAILGVAVLGLVALSAIGWSPLVGMFGSGGWSRSNIPFLYDSFHGQFALAAGALAIALGFKQSLGDLFGDAQLFVLHRPVSRRNVYLTKLTVGLALYGLIAGLTILAYAAWAATGGTHASPFAWSMTVPVWITGLAVGLVYLGAFLAGLRPAAWWGTRLMPLAGACALALLSATLPAWAGLTVALVAGAALVVSILFVAETRDLA